ncbi:MAG: hypothetical protein ABIJ09_06045 [Pseudomonadota bacterium]
MKGTALVLRGTVRSGVRLRAVAIVTTGGAIICVVGLAVLFGTQFIGPQLALASPDMSVVENFLGLILFTTSFISMGIPVSVLAFQSLAREKARGTITAVLATPLEPADLWLGKSIGVLVPGLLFAQVMTVASFVGLHLVYLRPVQGLVVTPWTLASCFIAVPLLYLALSLLVHLIGLVGAPGTANVVAQVFLHVVTALMINLAVRQVPDAGSWAFTAILLGLAAMLGVAVRVGLPRLTVERIVLSR